MNFRKKPAKLPLKIRKEASFRFHTWIRMCRGKVLTIGGKQIRITEADLKVFDYINIDCINAKTSDCFLKQETIAEALGYTRETVSRAVNKLKKIDVLRIVPRYRYETTRNAHGECVRALRVSNLYGITAGLLQRLKAAINGKLNALSGPVNRFVTTVINKLGTLIKKVRPAKEMTDQEIADFKEELKPPETKESPPAIQTEKKREIAGEGVFKSPSLAKAFQELAALKGFKKQF